MVAGATKPDKKRDPIKRRRLTAALLAMGLVVGGSAAFSALVWPGFAIYHPEVHESLVAPELAITGVMPLPRIGEQTDLVAEVPDIVQGWVQSGISPFLGWQNTADAVEAWTVIYRQRGPETALTTGEFDEITLVIGQWSTWRPALTFINAEVSEARIACQAAFCATGSECTQCPLLTGTVTQAATGEEVGTYSLFALAAEPSSSAREMGVMWWRNSTVVIQISGPLDALTEFYSAFRL